MTAPRPHCVAGHIGFELRCAERKFISLTSRRNSDLRDTAQMVALSREDNLLWLGPDCFLIAVALSPILRAAHRAVSLHPIEVRIFSPGQVGFELRCAGRKFYSFKLRPGALRGS